MRITRYLAVVALAMYWLGATIPFAVAQSGPQPVPSPWQQNGANIVYPNGCVLIGAATPPCSANTLITAPSTISGAGFNLPPGTAPTSPNNGDTWMTASHFYAEINDSTVQLDGVGTVTSVGLSMPAMFSVSGSPVTGSGTLTAALANENANTLFGNFSTSSATPTFSAISSLTLKSSPTTSDLILISDQAASGQLKYTTLGDLPGGGGGSPGGSSGDLQFNNGSGGFGGSAITATSAGNLSVPAATSSTVGNILIDGLPAFAPQPNSLFMGGSGNYTVSGDYNFALGEYSLAGQTTGNRNTAIGFDVFGGLTTGSYNIGIGFSTASAAITGQYNVVIGAAAANHLTSGGGNLFIGESAGGSMATGNSNIFIGLNSGSAYSGAESDNILFGGATGTAGENSTIQFADGGGNLRLDYGHTNSGAWTLPGAIYITTPATGTASKYACFTSSNELISSSSAC